MDGRHRDSRMTFNVCLVLLVSVTALLVEYLVLACNIEDARNTPDGLMRGWSGVAVDDHSVVELKQTVVNDAIVAKAHHVIESYQQVTSVMPHGFLYFNARNTLRIVLHVRDTVSLEKHCEI